jgi:hypothetical protein
VRDLIHGQPVDLSDRCPYCKSPVSYFASFCPNCTRAIDHRFNRQPPPISRFEFSLCAAILGVLMLGGFALIVIPMLLVLFSL